MSVQNTAVYVGCAGSSEIVTFDLDPASGKLREVARTALPGLEGHGSSTPMALSPDRGFLHVGFRGDRLSVVSFSIDPKTGALKHLGNAALGASMPYISVDPSGRWLIGSSFTHSKITVNPIGPDGRAGEPVQVLDAPEKPHCCVFAPNGDVYIASLGTDRILRYGLEAGRLVYKDDTKVRAGAGPRHIVFHPSGKLAYLVSEKDGSVFAFSFDKASGRLTEIETHNITPDGTKPWGGDIHLTPDGRFLYATERNSSTLSAFAVDAESGKLKPVARYPTASEPRGFAVDPGGNFVIVAGQSSADVMVHRIDQGTGALTSLGSTPVGPQPQWIEMVRVGA